MSTRMIGVVIAVFLTAGCSGPGQSEADKSAPAQKEAESQSLSLKTRAGMEQKLAEIGIPVYPGAAFDKVKHKTGAYKILYDIPDVSEEANQKVADFYADVGGKLETAGWKKMTLMSTYTFWYQKNRANITLTHNYAPKYDIHSLIFTYQD